MAADIGNLSKKFHSLIDTYFELEETALSTNDAAFQDKLESALDDLQKVGDLVESLDLYSDNETLADMATGDLKYFLLPSLWAALILKRDPNSYKSLQHKSTRLTCVTLAERNFDLFLRRVNTYNAAPHVPGLKVIVNELESKLYSESKDDAKANSGPRTEIEELTEAGGSRLNKIQRYKAGKEIKDKLAYLRDKFKTNSAQDGGENGVPNMDDDTLRQFYINLIEHFVFVTLDELDSIARELPILEHMEKMKQKGGADAGKPPAPRPPKAKQLPFIITKDSMQKQVFGLGYPSVPVMSIDDFISSKMEDGSLGHLGSGAAGSDMHSMQRWSEDPTGSRAEEEQEKGEMEDKQERDDAYELARKRAMDEWKDDNPRGAGNRYNRS